MMRRDHPTVIEHLTIGGLRPEILAELKARKSAAELARAMGDAHRKRQACHCALCEPFGPPLTGANDSGGGVSRDEVPAL